MEWGEAIRLVGRLANDTSSQTFAAVEKWDYPASLEALALYRLHDLTGQLHVGKSFDLHPRPFSTKGPREMRRHGNTGGRTREEVVAILNAHGHSLS